MNITDKRKVDKEDTLSSGKSGSLLRYTNRNKVFLPLVIGAAIVVLILLAALVFSGGKASTRTESYKKTSGAAGLQATITYDRHCDQKPCDQKPTFGFNVYIYDGNGQQVSVVRPDKDGKVNLALPEGEYVMLIGKQLGQDKLFPQELLSLKNGQTLVLKLQYKEVGL